MSERRRNTYRQKLVTLYCVYVGETLHVGKCNTAGFESCFVTFTRVTFLSWEIRRCR
jgi:hypothetical protein